jgi:uncharacterized protein (DUF4415 family)
MKTRPYPAVTDEEEARIQRGIAEDPDNPEWTAEDFARARPFAEVFPEWAEEIRQRQSGRPKSPDPKVAVSLRLDSAVVDHFKAQGPGWQTRINAALRAAAGINKA